MVQSFTLKENQCLQVHFNISITCCNQAVSHIFVFVLHSNPAIDCMVADWSEWYECNKSCGKGHTIRTRMVKLEPQFGGSPCPETIQRKRCKIRKCRTKAKEEKRDGRRKRRRHGKVSSDVALEDQQGGFYLSYCNYGVVTWKWSWYAPICRLQDAALDQLDILYQTMWRRHPGTFQ